MGRERAARFYNDAYRHSESYAKSAKDAPWAELWQAVAEQVEPNTCVLDLGCGAGHMAELLATRCRSYVGLDFSIEAIKRAAERAPWATFSLWNAHDTPPPTGFDVVLAVEFLEHISCDLEVLRALPSGTPVIITAPTRDSDGHVRFFTHISDFRARYGMSVEAERVWRVDQWYLMRGRIKHSG